jgi:molybdate transport system substrate-binding protein
MKKALFRTSLVLFLFCAFHDDSARADEVLIAVAANFTDATRDLLPLFESQTGHTAQASFGSTGKLYAQITHGAPFEVFLAADAARPLLAESDGWAVPGTRFTYATGQLVLWSAQEELFADGEAYLKGLTYSRLAIANPRTAPYGLAAQEVLEHLEIWDQVKDRLVQGDSIAQTFQFVATENAQVGFVARSQVLAWENEGGSSWIVPQDFHAPIGQQAVLLNKGEDNPAARAFMSFLSSSSARDIITGYGYGVE